MTDFIANDPAKLFRERALTRCQRNTAFMSCHGRLSFLMRYDWSPVNMPNDGTPRAHAIADIEHPRRACRGFCFRIHDTEKPIMKEPEMRVSRMTVSEYQSLYTWKQKCGVKLNDPPGMSHRAGMSRCQYNLLRNAFVRHKGCDYNDSQARHHHAFFVELRDALHVSFEYPAFSYHLPCLRNLLDISTPIANPSAPWWKPLSFWRCS